MGAAEEFNALVFRDPGAAEDQFRSLEEAFRSRGVLFAGAAMGTFLRPLFVPRSEWDDLRRASRRLLELAVALARRVYGGDVLRLCAALGTPEQEARIVAFDPGEPDCVLSRLDAFWTPGGPRFVEINSDAPAGFGYGDRMAELFSALPVFQEFARSRKVSYVPSGPSLVDAVVGAFRRRGGTGTPRVAILDWREVRTRSDQEILRELFLERGYPCLLLDPREVTLAGDRLLSPEGPIDVVYRRLVLSELVDREDEAKPLLEAYRRGIAVFVNSFRCRLSEDKVFLSILCDEREALPPGERAFLDRVLPWTRRVAEGKVDRHGGEVDLIPFVLGRKDELVLKPAHGYGGASVVVGDEATVEEWEGAVLRGLASPHVVQERVAIPEEIFPVLSEEGLRLEPRKVNLNPFYVEGAEAGAVARASMNSVINVSAGGGSVPVFVIE
jgi:hypothetical protein